MAALAGVKVAWLIGLPFSVSGVRFRWGGLSLAGVLRAVGQAGAFEGCGLGEEYSPVSSFLHKAIL
jgi:hypothetical protein